MKGFVYLAFYGMLASLLSMAQVNALQDSKQVLNALKQLELSQLLEVQITDQTTRCPDFTAIQGSTCQNVAVSSAFVNSASAATTSDQH